jgi:acyl-CoA synthetase (AMP-forming)/AMP-acid ligase II
MDEKTLQRNLIQRLNVGDALTRTAWRKPDGEAVVDGERRFTYTELNAATNRLANDLLARGVERGDPVVLMAGNCVEFLQSYYALAKIGAVAVPINLLWGAGEVGYVIEHSQPKLALVEPAFESVIGDLERLVTPFDLDGASPAEPERYVEDRDPLGYMYTSGTTSAPKGVVQTHMNVYMNSLTVSTWLHAAESWRYGIFMPLFHTAALGVSSAAILQGATIVLMRGFDPVALLDMIERERLTYFFGLPMMIRALMETPGFAERDLASLDTIGYAMAPMPDEDLRRALDAFGCNFTLGFGQTEMAPLTTVFPHEDQLDFAGSVGRQIPNVQTAIMDGDGNLLGPGETGEIVYRSPQTMAGYLHDDEATDEAFRFGWFHSGDVGHFDEHGVLWFEDRLKDVVKTGGENVASIEVERALYDAEPRILECVVVGLPDDRWGEAITAIVTPRPGEPLGEDEVIAAARTKLPSFKCPKRVVFREELPRTSTGKVQKNVLRQQLAETQTPARR